MRLPRDVSGTELARRLATVGYEPTRQTGSHIRLTRRTPEGCHHVTIPCHTALRVGTLSAILRDVATHLGMKREQLLRTILD